MTVTIFRTRMAMSEKGYAYDGVVALAELGIDHKPGCTTICRQGGRYVSFVDATRPADLDEMPLGWERYQAALSHERRANEQLLTLAKGVYPELEPAVRWPELWVVIPGLEATHATRTIRVTA